MSAEAAGARQPELPRRIGVEPFHLLAAIMAAYLVLGTIGPIRDIDAYWHVRLGDEILEQRSLAGPGSTWSFAVQNADWRSTQWLAEIVFSQAHAWWGWNGIVAYRGVLTLVLLLVVAWSCLRGVPARIGALVFATTGLACVIGIQDRPLLIGLCAMPLLALTWQRGVVDGRWPRWWLVLPATVVLANIHGIWILIPAVLGLAVLGRWVDHGWTDRPARTGLVLAAATLAAGAVSPLGVANVTSVLRFRDAARLNNEWQPTTIDFFPAWALAALVALIVLAWARSTAKAPRSELLYVAALALFGMTAFRNVLPAVLLLAPIAARRAALAWPTRRAFAGRLEGRILLAGIAVLLGASTLVAAVSWFRSDPLPDDGSQPFGIATRLGERAEPLRLFNEYNVAGAVLAFADPEVLVGVDGRVDFYGGDYVERYFDTGFGIPGTFANFEALAPDAALLNSSYTPLYETLLGQLWTVTDREGDWVLLEPPAD